MVRVSTKSIAKYLGWIYGNREDIDLLRSLGVQGEMSWHFDTDTDKSGIFAFCIITMDVAKKLRDNYDAFRPTHFTAVDAEGNQTIDQPLLHGNYD